MTGPRPLPRNLAVHGSPVQLRSSDWKALGRQLLLLTALMLAAHFLSGPVIDLLFAT